MSCTGRIDHVDEPVPAALTAGMYEARIDALTRTPVTASNRFGLNQGQIRPAEIVHNGTWLNAAGAKLGWGDLDTADLTAIAAGLHDDEIFVVADETIAWRPAAVVDEHGRFPLGVIAEHIEFLITAGHIHQISIRQPQGAPVTARGRATFDTTPATYLRLGTAVEVLEAYRR